MIAVYESDNVYVRELNNIKSVGYQYEHFICNRHFPGKGRLHLWCDKLRRVKYYPNFNKNYSLYLLQKGNYDVFHPTFFNDYFLPYLNGKPFVLTIHDMIPWVYSGINNSNWNWQLAQIKKLAPLANAIITVSENTKKDIVRFLNVPEDRIHVVYHGCSFSPVGEKCLFSFPYVLFVGERGLYKNFMNFVKMISPILKKHKDLHVVCTGRPFSQNELNLMNVKGVGDKFVSCWVNKDVELYSLYHNAKCLVFPSEYEGFGIPILEAYQAECPVLLNNASCFPEIAGDAAIYFEMSNEDSNLAEQLERLLAMSFEEREALLSKQRERLSRYSWEESAKKLVEVYKSVCQ